MLETKLENETHSEPDINILTTLLIKEKGKDKPGCQKQNVVHFPVEKSVLFQNKDIDCSLPTQSNLDNKFSDKKLRSRLYMLKILSCQ